MIIKDKSVYEEYKNISTEDYFEGNQFSIDAFKKKYALHPKETYVQAIKRVCDAIASVESTPELREYWSDRWFSEIYNDWWHPAGSIMQGAGSGKSIALSNCTYKALGTNDKANNWDNLESIIRNTAYSVAKSAAFRQGLGVDFSHIRPKGTTVKNSANQSTGAVHWMQFIDSIAYYVGQSGRRPAFLFSLSCSHPDIEEFIQVKKDYTKIQNANISVQCTDDFYTAVENDTDWELKFIIPKTRAGDKIYIDVDSIVSSSLKDEIGYYNISSRDREEEVFTKTIKARKLLELIAKNMCANAEPGIQNIDLAHRYSNSDALYDPDGNFDSRIIGSNACSEQYLDRDGLCFLASINANKFSTKQEEYIQELESIGKSINRFLDNVNEYELMHKTYATDHQRLSIQNLRRTGAGVTDICGWLFKQDLEYGSKEGNNTLEDFIKWYNYWMYISSENNGKEKGNFGAFNSDKWKKAIFVKRLIEESKELNKKFGVPILTGDYARNITCSSIAPTGSLSLQFRGTVLSYGIEPAFFIYYWKRTRISGKYEYYFCVPKVIKDQFYKLGIELPMESDTIKDDWAGTKGKIIAEIIDKHRDKFKFKESIDINPLDKLELMSRIMKWIDSSISVTYLLPENSDWKDVYNFILQAHKKEVKSIAAFPDKKMYGIVSKIPFRKLADNLISEGIDIHPQNFSDDELKELNISRDNITPVGTAPARLDSLDADIHVVSVKGDKFVIVVGLQNNKPYEIFGGHANGFGFKFTSKKGKISKVKSGQYALEIGDLIIEDFAKKFTPAEQILFRMTSTSLRHGVPIESITEQLQKASADITSMGAAAARVLKKYIKDGTKVDMQQCPSCKSTSLIYIDGCVSCSICQWSKCS